MSYPQPQPAGTSAYKAEPPLWAPFYGAPFLVSVKRFWQKYATFSGRASRSEYWWWTLVAACVTGVINIVSGTGTTDFSTGAGGEGSILGIILAFFWAAATIVPSIALTMRRLHDVNMSGWLVLIALIPVVGVLALLVLMILPSNPAGQRFDRPEAAPVGY